MFNSLPEFSLSGLLQMEEIIPPGFEVCFLLFPFAPQRLWHCLAGVRSLLHACFSSSHQVVKPFPETPSSLCDAEKVLQVGMTKLDWLKCYNSMESLWPASCYLYRCSFYFCALREGDLASCMYRCKAAAKELRQGYSAGVGGHLPQNNH